MTTAAMNNLWTYLSSLSLTQKNKEWLMAKLQEPADTRMSEEEFYAKIDKSIAEIERGECIVMEPDETGEEFLNRILCTK